MKTSTSAKNEVKNLPKWALIKELFAGRQWRVIKALFFVTLKAAPVWLIPIITARIIDLGHDDIANLKQLAIYVAIAILLYLQNIPSAIWYMSNLVHFTRGIGQDLRIRICEQLQALSLYYHRRSSVGSLHSKAIRDIEILETLPRLAIEQGYSFILGITISSIAIFIRKPEALLFFFLTVPICAVVSSLFKRRMSNSVNEYRKSLEGMSTHLNEMVTMMPITRAHGLEQKQLQSMESGIRGVFQRGVHFDKLTAVFAAVSWVVMGVMQMLFLGGSMYACFQRQITVGDVVMFNAFFITLSNTLANLLTFVPQLLQSRESLESVIEILNAPDLEKNSGKGIYQELHGDFKLDNVSFSFPESDRAAIKNLTLHIPAGTSLAIAGPSGSGKSTLLSLLIGFAHPEEGNIILDGKDMKNMDLRSYRQHVGIVTQDPVFFSGSVRENISYGNDEVSDAQVAQALEQAHANEFVQALPEGLDTRLGINGIRLSGGQMQRLAIARAIIRDPKVLILDEATSALDSISEVHVQKAIDNVMKNRTTFMVAHRISTIKNADRIAILENGGLVNCESPKELLKTDNFYSQSVKNSKL
ncbi:ABC transporter ATP-binding protein/permease [Puniceicoccaceae bacterium K14]|nr:ABC transporter ATP-binding protein/permease [Puniceicoccaceae bacterium K14]